LLTDISVNIHRKGFKLTGKNGIQLKYFVDIVKCGEKMVEKIKLKRVLPEDKVDAICFGFGIKVNYDGALDLGLQMSGLNDAETGEKLRSIKGYLENLGYI
jgi:hypothetical protein